jgi:hypothetical protein
MTIEAIVSVNVRFQDRGLAYRLKAGDRVDLPDDLADRILSKVPDKIRVVAPPACP